MQIAICIPKNLDASPLQPGLPSLWRVTLSIGERIRRQRKKPQLVIFSGRFRYKGVFTNLRHATEDENGVQKQCFWTPANLFSEEFSQIVEKSGLQVYLYAGKSPFDTR
jgi:hypothetical protein